MVLNKIELRNLHCGTFPHASAFIRVKRGNLKYGVIGKVSSHSTKNGVNRLIIHHNQAGWFVDLSAIQFCKYWKQWSLISQCARIGRTSDLSLHGSQRAFSTFAMYSVPAERRFQGACAGA